MLARLLLLLWSALWSATAIAAERPNVLWITTEDIGPQLGCYGDKYAVTPNLDAFARTACRYLHCWSNAPVCAPARTTIITGMYPPSLGAEHMRSMVKLPAEIRLYPQYLRDAGYYCTNNSKEDYNVEPNGKVWDESSNKAHWKNRPAGKPFFAIFNHTITHESQIRNAIDPQDRIHDPAGVRVPAYHPDTPAVRKDWAQYYDRITMTDKLFAQNLKELHDAGLAEDTLVFFYGDHGSGMPRGKRTACNSGLHVPLLIHVPEKWKHLATADCVMGGTSDRLVSFVDLAPTLLSLCGVEIPAHMQGHAFLGAKATAPQPYLFGFRGRMDERIDMVRSVTDGRYVYVRNFMPHLPHGQHVNYQFQTPTTRVWYETWQAGKCNAAQSRFWQPRETEELYDLQSDPDEVVNLASDPEHFKIRNQLAERLQSQMRSIRDTGLLPEAMTAEWNHAATIYGQMQSVTASQYEFLLEKALALTSGQSPDAVGELSADGDVLRQAIIFWKVIGLQKQGASAVVAAAPRLRPLAASADPSVRIAAAEALGVYGNADDLALALPVLLEYANAEHHGVYNAVHALNAIDHLGEKADAIRDQVAKLPQKDPQATARTDEYCARLIEFITHSEPRP